MPLFSFFKKKRKDHLLPQLEQYLDLFANSASLTRPVRECKFVVLDTETTGLDYKKDHLLSIAALKLENNQILINDRIEFFIQQNDYIGNDSVKIHGILPGQSQRGIPEKEALLQLISYLGDAVIIGHHIGFDLAILNQAMQKHFGLKLKNKKLDTLQIARRIHHTKFQPAPPDFKYSLDFLCNHYEIPLGERHTAADDVFITALLFLKMYSRLEKRGVRTLKSLLK